MASAIVQPHESTSSRLTDAKTGINVLIIRIMDNHNCICLNVACNVWLVFTYYKDSYFVFQVKHYCI